MLENTPFGYTIIIQFLRQKVNHQYEQNIGYILVQFAQKTALYFYKPPTCKNRILKEFDR